MKSKYQNLFFAFGLLLLLVMAMQLDLKEVWKGLQHAGYWFFAVIALWAFLYVFNVTTWYLIIRSQDEGDSPRPSDKISLPWLYKVTVSGFALNYATPGGLMGGEPYKIMELAPVIGTERASSSVILHTMTHIFSHFWFWLLSVALFLLFEPVSLPMAFVLSCTTLFCLLGIWFFQKGYRSGLANRVMRLLGYIPFVKRWAKKFVEQHKQQLDTIDSQIAALHSQKSRTFVAGVLLELSCRLASALEIYFILRVLSADVSYANCILILAFTSLLANLLFFMPLQLGGREGGFLLSTTGLGLTVSTGAFVALIVRVRELFWTGLGLLLIKISNRKKAGDRFLQ